MALKYCSTAWARISFVSARACPKKRQHDVSMSKTQALHSAPLTSPNSCSRSLVHKRPTKTLFSAPRPFLGLIYAIGDVTLLASKQKCRSVSQVTVTTRISEELKLLLTKKLKEAQRQAVDKQRLYSPVQTSQITTAHRPKQGETNHAKAPVKHVRTTEWCLYKSSHHMPLSTVAARP